MAKILTEDFNKLRRINKKLVHTDFLKEWMFRLGISGAPKDFDLYIKDISYGVFDVATDEGRLGAAVYNWPTGVNLKRCSFTVRDHQDCRIQDFFVRWLNLVFPGDGTVNPPYAKGIGYLKKVKLYEITIDGTEKAVWELHMYPITVGDSTRSRSNGNFFEIPVTLVEFSSII